MLVLGFVLYGSTTLLPLFLQMLLGYTAMLSGLVLSPGGIVVCVCLPMVGLLTQRVQPRWLVIFGVLVSSLGLFYMSRFNLTVDYRTALSARVVQSFGLAFLFVPISATAFAFVPKDRTNYAAGLFNLARNIGGSSGIATITTMLARRSQYHQQVLTAHMTPYDLPYRTALERTTQLLYARGYSLPDAGARAHGMLYGSLVRQASMLSFADTFWLVAVLFLAIVPLMLLMRKTGAAKGIVPVE
jgi:MFS transporter, DHA2 family, multidrug resistance protein